MKKYIAIFGIISIITAILSSTCLGESPFQAANQNTSDIHNQFKNILKEGTSFDPATAKKLLYPLECMGIRIKALNANKKVTQKISDTCETLPELLAIYSSVCGLRKQIIYNKLKSMDAFQNITNLFKTVTLEHQKNMSATLKSKNSETPKVAVDIDQIILKQLKPLSAEENSILAKLLLIDGHASVMNKSINEISFVINKLPPMADISWEQVREIKDIYSRAVKFFNVSLLIGKLQLVPESYKNGTDSYELLNEQLKQVEQSLLLGEDITDQYKELKTKIQTALPKKNTAE